MVQVSRRLKLALAALVAAAGIAAGLWVWKSSLRQVERQPLGLMTSLPIYWPEGAELTLTIEGNQPLPWVRQALESRYAITPLDSLAESDDGAGGKRDPLAGLERLLIAQPRGLSPQDNVALDDWVRGGGRLLFVLDPMLAGRYAVPFGDPRHPVSVGLIPPVLTRWGLGMSYTDEQPFELHERSYGTGSVPVLLAGQVVALGDNPDLEDEDRAARGACRILGDGIAAQCDVGQGKVTLLADAALLELPEPHGNAEDQLYSIASLAFD